MKLLLVALGCARSPVTFTAPECGWKRLRNWWWWHIFVRQQGSARWMGASGPGRTRKHGRERGDSRRCPEVGFLSRRRSWTHYDNMLPSRRQHRRRKVAWSFNRRDVGRGAWLIATAPGGENRKPAALGFSWYETREQATRGRECAAPLARPHAKLWRVGSFHPSFSKFSQISFINYNRTPHNNYNFAKV